MLKKKTTPTGEPSNQVSVDPEQLQQQLQEAQAAAQTAYESERRALADYQNLQRRQNEQRLQLMQMANRELLLDLLEPLGNLERAADQLQDKGLQMVVGQFKQKMENAGLEEIEVLGRQFDVTTMEAADGSDGEAAIAGGVVTAVQRKGYTLNGAVIQHARVVVGVKN